MYDDNNFHTGFVKQNKMLQFFIKSIDLWGDE